MNARMDHGFQPLAVAADDLRARAVQRIADSVHRANEDIRRAVESGISVELVRTGRHHDGNGNWGDQIMPAICEKAAPRPHHAGSPS